MRCQRCGREAGATIVSMFNTQTICLSCKSVEEKHPDYEKACLAERVALMHGDYNFEGIGWPRP